MEKEKYIKSGENLISNIFFLFKGMKAEINSHSQGEGFSL